MGGKGSGRKPAKPKRGRGQPTKCTPGTTKTICDAVQKGHYLETAAALAGCTPHAVRLWLKHAQGPRPKPEYVNFFAAYKRAEAKAQESALDDIREHRSEHWQSAAWRMERRWPAKWGRWERPVEQQQQGPTTLSEAAKSLNLKALTADELRILQALIAKAGAGVDDGPKDE